MNSPEIRLVIATPDDMEALGARMAPRLRAGDMIALNGELGAGKTTFTRGLGAALGVRGMVTSPTFVLARTHPSSRGVPLVHVDAYRLTSSSELEDLDLDLAGSIVVVEWAAGMIDGLVDNWLTLTIDRPMGSVAAGDEHVETEGQGGGPAEVTEPRGVVITGHGPRWADFRL